MLTRLHRQILRSLPLPFAAALLTLLFLLLMQFLIAYLPDLVGRGLPVLAVAELIAYAMAYILTLAVPMAWLIALLAAFGRLAESRGYLVAKSAGVSLPRLAWPALAAGVALTAGMAYFNNQMLPEANYRMSGLWRDIRVSQPGFALTPGEFYTDVAGYAIRADAIPPDSSGLLEGVTVFETDPSGGTATLTAARARLQSQYGGQRLTMLLENGHIDRRTPEGEADRYQRLAFDRYRMAFDLSSLGEFERRSETAGGRSDRTMRTSDMLAVVDSLDRTADAQADSVRTAFARWGRSDGDVARVPDEPSADSSAAPTVGTDRVVLEGLGDPDRRAVYALASERARWLRTTVTTAASARQMGSKQAGQFRVEIYKKNSLALACLVFVLIGVPLGLAVPRAGVGVVATLAVATFLFYWVSLVGGEKLADREMLPPWLGMWAANVIFGVLGVYLVVRETRDPAWRDPIRALAGRFKKRG